MNVATLLGLVIALGFILGSVVAEGGHLSALVNLPAAMIVFGGTLGATIMGLGMDDVRRLPAVTRMAFIARVPDPVGVCRKMVAMAQLARRDGFLGLEQEIPALQESNPFLAKALQMVADGTAPETVTEVLYTEMDQLVERHHRGAAMLETMGGLAPTLGVTGTVMGLVHMMGSIDDPSAMGPAIAGAFLATLYGVASANVVFLPLGNKLKAISNVERHTCEIVIEAVRGIQRGDSPILVAEVLKAFLPPGARAQLDEVTGPGAHVRGGGHEQAQAA
ncbi:MAG: motility protein A [candidate division WS1 bacterium]|nr:motility protein A [candidate division WS1 bacterium]